MSAFRIGVDDPVEGRFVARRDGRFQPHAPFENRTYSRPKIAWAHAGSNQVGEPRDIALNGEDVRADVSLHLVQVLIGSLFGGMAGCAMIGQSIINVTSGARGRLSTLWAGLFLLFLILVLQDWVARIPMAALVAVMIMVSVGTFDWKSVLTLRSTPVQSSIVMLATTITVVVTHDLSKGVVLGVILSAIFFMRKLGKTIVVQEIETPEPGVLRYHVSGQLFFGSADVFAASFEHHSQPTRVEIDMSDVHLWDLTAVVAVDKVVFRYRRQGAEVRLIGMNEAAQSLIQRVGKHDKAHLPVGIAH
ncbi:MULTISPECIES: SulP family inorganic anion transporter [unclassified Brevundimonas]|uniref:SulP family inorganic anion transporter n=1 Tax=unclassified Brevundimonas TaxID=2622653 RepID=UPI0025BF1C6D|nr:MULTISPECIES: STAS domain-containing protein [unclassified Brevundimonas]